MAKAATRLIICVDGTSPTASTGVRETNVYRIFNSIQRGNCTDSSSGITFNQSVSYIPGKGSTDDSIDKDRLQDRLFGKSYLKQIEEVYNNCSRLTHQQDEVWLFGFGRGAFVVRAVAGLLHKFGAGAAISKDFKEVFRGSANSRPAPRIQFVGVFDTIKAADDDTFDTSFNRSIYHMRHALALHEDRKSLAPDIQDLYDTKLQEYGRTFVQAYFVGRHEDMGGSAKKWGLALYPYHWMMIEARKCGLVLDSTIQDRSGDDHDPLSMIFAKEETRQERTGENKSLWSFTTANGIQVTMQDLRRVHSISSGHQKHHEVKLASPILGSIRQKQSRDAFTTTGYLRGYCDWASQGSIIHPSVYLLVDEHIHVSLETKELKLQRYMEDWRDKMLGKSRRSTDTESWLRDSEDDSGDPGAIRVLVCGNTGVGKSTLINKTFGVDITQSSHRTRGIHDVREEITWEGRSDLIVHDSGGFEAGADEEFQAIEAFLKDRSAVESVLDRVHVIWFCIDVNSARTLQSATEKLFSAVARYAQDVPVVVVATKKDDFLAIQFEVYRRVLKKEKKIFDEEECGQYAERRLQERMDTIRGEMESVPGGRLDACLAVSQDDDDSISDLSKTTSHCFDTDRVRLLYIRAQVTRIDLKVDLAHAEIMRQYKKLLRRTGSTLAPLGATITRKLSNAQVTKNIINCFGLPTVTAEMALKSLKATISSQVGNNVQLALAEAFQLLGLSVTGLAFGAPIWLATGSMNASHVIPTTCRLFLIMACDLTLILARSFKESTFRAGGQPNEMHVGAAARNYAVRGYAHHVHRDIKKLIPRKDILASFKVEAIHRGVEDLFGRYRQKLLDNVDLPLTARSIGETDESWDDTSTEADSILFSDVKEADITLGELEAGGAPPIAELDGRQPIFELPA